jgi:hypothetical protein
MSETISMSELLASSNPLTSGPAVGTTQLQSRFGTMPPPGPLAVAGSPNDQFTKQASPSNQPGTLTPAMLAALSPAPTSQQTLPPGTVDPRTTAIALMLLQQQNKRGGPLPNATGNGLPRPAALTLQGSPTGSNIDNRSISEPEKPPFSLKSAMLSALAAIGLAKGADIAMNLFDGSDWHTGEAIPEKQATSGLATVTRFLDTKPVVSNISNAIDNHWGPKANGNASVKQLLGALTPEELDAKLLGAQFDAFNKAMSSMDYPPEFRSFINQKELETVLKKPITELPTWAKEGLIRKQVLTAPAELGDDALLCLYDKVMKALPVDAPPNVDWQKTPEELATLIGTKDGKTKLANFIQAQMLEPSGKLLSGDVLKPEMTAVVDALPGDPKMMAWMDDHLATTLSKSPNQARHMALEVFGELAQKELGSAEQFLKLQNEIQVLKGGWTRPLNALPFNNVLRNVTGKLLGKKSEAEAVKDLSQRALDAFDKYPEQSAKFNANVIETLKATAQGAEGSLKITTRQELLDYLTTLERGISTEVKQAQSLSGHVKGFIGRVGRQMGLVAQPYRNTYQTMAVLGDQSLAIKAKAGPLLNAVEGITEANKEDVLTAMGKGADALTEAAKKANLTDDVVTALLAIEKQTSQVGPLKGLSRAFVGFYQTMKGVFNGKIFEEALTSGGHAAGKAAANGFLDRTMSIGGKVFGPLMIFLFPALETLDADNTPGEKIKTFFRGVLGAGIGGTLGWSAMHTAIAMLGLDRSVGRNFQMPLLTVFGNAITRGGFVAELSAALIGGAFVDSLGRKISDVLFGKPLHIQRKEAKEKLEKAQKEQVEQLRKQQVEQMRRQAQGAPAIAPNSLPYAAATPLQRGQQQPTNQPAALSMASPLPSDRLPLAAAQSLNSPTGGNRLSTNTGSVITGTRKPAISALTPSDIASVGDRTSWRGLNEAQ